MEKSYAKYCDEYRIRVENVDCFDRLKPSGLMLIFQDIAVAHSNHIKMSHYDLYQKNLFWVLTHIHITMHKTVFLDDIVTACTYMPQKTLVGSVRYIDLFDKDGVLAARAETKWCMLATNTRRIQRIDDSIFPEGVSFEPCPRLENTKKIPSVSTSAKQIYSYAIGLSDLDKNFHTNNVRYLDMMFSSFSLDELNKRNIKKFSINYIKETMLNDQIILYKEDVSDTVSLVEARLICGETVFKSEIIFDKPIENPII